jgi:replicative DNA helicase
MAASRGITPEMFYGYQAEYEWLENYILRRGRTPSVQAFRAVFDEFPVKKVDDIELYIEEVRESHAKQILIKGLNSISKKIGSGNLEAAIKELSSVSLSAESSLLGHGTDGDIFSEYSDIEEEINRRAAKVNDTGYSGIPTGFPTLDELTGGIQPGWFVVISARAGVGKTRSLIRMACAAAFSGYTVQYDALEQTRPEIAMQVHAHTSSEFGHGVFKSLDLAQGRVNRGNYKKFLQNTRETIQGKMHVADTSRNAITETTIAAQIERNQPDIVFLDYMTIMESANGYENAAQTSKRMAALAKHYRRPIITAAQINRVGAQARDVSLEHLADSDEIGRSADLVVNVTHFKDCKSVLVMHVIKFRHGPSGWKLYLKFDPNQGVMEEITYDEALELKDVELDKSDQPKDKKFVPRKKGSFHQAALRRKSAPDKPADGPVKAKGHSGKGKHPKGPEKRSQERPKTITIKRKVKVK